MHTKFGNSGFSRDGYMIAGIEIEIGHATLTTPIFAVVCHLKA